MSTFTSTSRVTGKTDITHTLDAARVNPCKVHGVKPRFYVITWGRGRRHQQGATAECESEDCLCFDTSALDIVGKWNRFNPQGDDDEDPRKRQAADIGMTSLL